MKTDEIFAKVKATAAAAGQAAAQAADKTAKSAERFVETAKLQYQIYERKGEVDALYKDVGRLMHMAHQNKPVEEGRLNELLAGIDEKLAELETLQDRKAQSRNRIYCKSCGQTSDAGQAFCGVCGAPFEADPAPSANGETPEDEPADGPVPEEASPEGEE